MLSFAMKKYRKNEWAHRRTIGMAFEVFNKFRMKLSQKAAPKMQDLLFGKFQIDHVAVSSKRIKEIKKSKHKELDIFT